MLTHLRFFKNDVADFKKACLKKNKIIHVNFYFDACIFNNTFLKMPSKLVKYLCCFVLNQPLRNTTKCVSVLGLFASSSSCFLFWHQKAARPRHKHMKMSHSCSTCLSPHLNIFFSPHREDINLAWLNLAIREKKLLMWRSSRRMSFQLIGIVWGAVKSFVLLLKCCMKRNHTAVKNTSCHIFIYFFKIIFFALRVVGKSL